MPRQVELTVRVSEDAASLARAAAAMFVAAARGAVARQGVARIAISGGSTPKAMFEVLAEGGDGLDGEVPWGKVQLFWVDERCVGPEDAESNYGMTKRAMLDAVPLPAENVHRMEGELEPEQGAARYEATIRTAFRLEGAETPTFDLILLGMGEDGHTASLFPHTEALDALAAIVVANHVPQKETWRLTLTWPVIAQGREVAFLCEGAGKAGILHEVFKGRYDPETHPAQLIRPASGKLTLLADKAAAAELSLTLSDEQGGAEKTGVLHLK